MLDFIMVPTVMAIICAGIYGLFELFVRRNERMAIIEKIGDKLDASAFEGKLGLPSYTKKYSFSSLKAGLLLAGIGLGLLVGFLININALPYNQFGNDWNMREVSGIVYRASVLFFGGLGLILSFIIEISMSKKKD